MRAVPEFGRLLKRARAAGRLVVPAVPRARAAAGRVDRRHGGRSRRQNNVPRGDDAQLGVHLCERAQQGPAQVGAGQPAPHGRDQHGGVQLRRQGAAQGASRSLVPLRPQATRRGRVAICLQSTCTCRSESAAEPSCRPASRIVRPQKSGSARAWEPHSRRSLLIPPR